MLTAMSISYVQCVFISLRLCYYLNMMVEADSTEISSIKFVNHWLADFHK